MANTVNGNSETSSESLNGKTSIKFANVNSLLRNVLATSISCFFPLYLGSWVNLDGSLRNGNSVHHSPTGSQSGAMEDLLAEAVEDHYRQNSKYVFLTVFKFRPLCLAVALSALFANFMYCFYIDNILQL